jgi:hypothetical protein
MSARGFWLTPECKRIPCKFHYSTAMRVFPDLKAVPATVELMKAGFIRCVVMGDDLIYEIRAPATEKQMAELKSIALEDGLRLLDDRGRIVAHEKPTWTERYL